MQFKAQSEIWCSPNTELNISTYGHKNYTLKSSYYEESSLLTYHYFYNILNSFFFPNTVTNVFKQGDKVAELTQN